MCWTDYASSEHAARTVGRANGLLTALRYFFGWIVRVYREPEEGDARRVKSLSVGGRRGCLEVVEVLLRLLDAYLTSEWL